MNLKNVKKESIREEIAPQTHTILTYQMLIQWTFTKKCFKKTISYNFHSIEGNHLNRRPVN